MIKKQIIKIINDENKNFIMIMNMIMIQKVITNKIQQIDVYENNKMKLRVIIIKVACSRTSKKTATE